MAELAMVFVLTLSLAHTADASPAQIFAIPGESSAARSVTTASPVQVAHLDEQNVPAAENPTAPRADSTTAAPDENPGPSQDWERVAPPGSSVPSGNPATDAKPTAPVPGAPPNPSAAPPIPPSAAGAHSDKALASVPANGAAPLSGGAMHTASLTTAQTAASSSHASTLMPGAPAPDGAATDDANNSGVAALRNSDEAGNQSVNDANAGPPPALDIGSIQSGPDLADTSLDGEIKKADTPALMAALRVTEQARLELRAGQTAEAIRDLGRAVSIDPGNPFGYFYLGRAYIARRNYTQALTFLQRAEIGFAARPDWLGTNVGFEGNCYEELGQNEDAALAYQRALGTAPNDLTARVGYTRLAAFLPSPPSPPDQDAAAETGPTHEALPAPRDDAAKPAPAEPPPPPPPASNPSVDGAPKQSPAWDYPPD